MSSSKLAGMDVAGDRQRAGLVGGVDEPVERLGGGSGRALIPEVDPEGGITVLMGGHQQTMWLPRSRPARRSTKADDPGQ